MWKKTLATVLLASACNATDPTATGLVDDAEPDFIDESAPVQGKADGDQAFPESCRKMAVAAVANLEKQNTAKATVKQVTDGGRFGDQRTLKVEVVRKLNGKAEMDTLDVDVSEDGSDCWVYAVRSTKRVPEASVLAPDVYEAGATALEPGAGCQYAAKKAATKLIALNQGTAHESVSGYVGFLSKSANVLEVGIDLVAPGAEVDALVTYVVKTEPRRNSACLIWGIQNGLFYADRSDTERVDDKPSP